MFASLQTDKIHAPDGVKIRILSLSFKSGGVGAPTNSRGAPTNFRARMWTETPWHSANHQSVRPRNPPRRHSLNTPITLRVRPSMQGYASMRICPLCRWGANLETQEEGRAVGRGGGLGGAQDSGPGSIQEAIHLDPARRPLRHPTRLINAPKSCAPRPLSLSIESTAYFGPAPRGAC